MTLQKETSELIKAGIISEETAEKIKGYYKTKETSSTNRLFVVFGVLGAILVGLGIILIIAHNWDNLSKTIKTVLAFVPLIIGQLFAGYSLLKRKDSQVWKESSSAFLFFSVGAAISLISQIYNIHGNLSSFLFTWLLLCLPLVYVMRSSITSLLYIAGITYYSVEIGYSSYLSSLNYNFYWILLLLILPYYYLLFRKKPKSNSMIFHNWLLPLSLLISLGTIADKNEELMFISYVSLLGMFYLLGNTKFFSEQKLRNNSYKILGSLGTIGILLNLSFNWFWQDLRTKEFVFEQLFSSNEFIVSSIITVLALGLLFFRMKNINLKNIKPISHIFVLFILIFILGMTSSVAVILINLIVFVIGILTIREGAGQNHLGILNYGLLIITILVVCRFFDTELSFVLRGLLFVIVGTGFFFANYLMLKKRKHAAN